MKRVLTAVVLIPLVLALVFAGPLWTVALVVYFFVVVGVREYLDILVRYGITPVSKTLWVIVGLAGALAIALSAHEIDGSMTPRLLLQISMVVIASAPYVLVVAAFRRPLKDAVPSAALTYLAVPWIVMPMLLMIAYRGMPSGWFYVLYVLVVVWSGDIFAYYVGRAIGSHRLAPEISPKKSWEGAVASLVSSAALAALLAYFGPAIGEGLQGIGVASFEWDYPPALWAAIGAVFINAAAQVGDLAESLLKRGAGVKDSGTLLPGHGGVLDRIDALLFASPVAGIVFVVWEAIRQSNAIVN